MKKAAGLMLVLALCLGVCGTAKAVDKNNFIVNTTKQLADLCNATPEDPLYEASIHFCHGYLVGAYHYYMAQAAGPDGDIFLCIPDPKPARNDVIANFLNWVGLHPQYLEDLPVETEFRYLAETYPCR